MHNCMLKRKQNHNDTSYTCKLCNTCWLMITDMHGADADSDCTSTHVLVKLVTLRNLKGTADPLVVFALRSAKSIIA